MRFLLQRFALPPLRSRHRRVALAALGGLAGVAGCAVLLAFTAAQKAPQEGALQKDAAGAFGLPVSLPDARFLARGLGLEVREVWVAGRSRLPAEELRTALAVERGDLIFAHDLARMQERVAALGWVESAALRRRLPGELYLVIRERSPCARHQSGGALAVADAGGSVIRGAEAAGFAGLPLLVGRGALPEGCARWTTWAAAAESLGSPLRSAVRVGERRWDLVLADGVTLMLPEEGADEVLARFVRLHQETRLFAALHIRAETLWQAEQEAEAAKAAKAAAKADEAADELTDAAEVAEAPSDAEPLSLRPELLFVDLRTPGRIRLRGYGPVRDPAAEADEAAALGAEGGA